MKRGRDQRFCTQCGRQMVPYRASSYPQYEWLRCPKYGWWSLFTGAEHDLAIIGDRDPSGGFDPVTGQPR